MDSIKVDKRLDTAAKSPQHWSDAHQPDSLPEIQSASADIGAALSRASKVHASFAMPIPSLLLRRYGDALWKMS